VPVARLSQHLHFEAVVSRQKLVRPDGRGLQAPECPTCAGVPPRMGPVFTTRLQVFSGGSEALGCIRSPVRLKLATYYDDQAACFSMTCSAAFSASRTCFRHAFQAAFASRRDTAWTISCISFRVSGSLPGLDIEVERYCPT
jgi:hypothetical protein